MCKFIIDNITRRTCDQLQRDLSLCAPKYDWYKSKSDLGTPTVLGYAGVHANKNLWKPG